MSERTAMTLTYLGSLLATAISVLGLNALGAGESIVVFGFLIPLAVGAYFCAKITVHYGAKRRKR